VGARRSTAAQATRSRAERDRRRLSRVCGAPMNPDGLSPHLFFSLVFLNPVAAEAITRHTSHITRHTSHVTHHTSHITRHTSHITHHTSHVTRHTSHVTHHTSHITHHTSHITHHTSHITHHTSHITHHTSPQQGAAAALVCFDLCNLSTLEKCQANSTALFPAQISRAPNNTAVLGRRASKIRTELPCRINRLQKRPRDPQN